MQDTHVPAPGWLPLVVGHQRTFNICRCWDSNREPSAPQPGLLQAEPPPPPSFRVFWGNSLWAETERHLR